MRQIIRWMNKIQELDGNAGRLGVWLGGLSRSRTPAAAALVMTVVVVIAAIRLSARYIRAQPCLGFGPRADGPAVAQPATNAWFPRVISGQVLHKICMGGHRVGAAGCERIHKSRGKSSRLSTSLTLIYVIDRFVFVFFFVLCLQNSASLMLSSSLFASPCDTTKFEWKTINEPALGPPSWCTSNGGVSSLFVLCCLDEDTYLLADGNLVSSRVMSLKVFSWGM